MENWFRQPMTWRVFFASLAAVGDDSQQTIPETTPWKINMEPENDGLEDDFPFNWVIFRFHVILPGCNSKSL